MHPGDATHAVGAGKRKEIGDYDEYVAMRSWITREESLVVTLALGTKKRGKGAREETEVIRVASRRRSDRVVDSVARVIKCVKEYA